MASGGSGPGFDDGRTLNVFGSDFSISPLPPDKKEKKKELVAKINRCIDHITREPDPASQQQKIKVLKKAIPALRDRFKMGCTTSFFSSKGGTLAALNKAEKRLTDFEKTKTDNVKVKSKELTKYFTKIDSKKHIPQAEDLKMLASALIEVPPGTLREELFQKAQGVFFKLFEECLEKPEKIAKLGPIFQESLEAALVLKGLPYLLDLLKEKRVSQSVPMLVSCFEKLLQNAPQPLPETLQNIQSALKAFPKLDVDQKDPALLMSAFSFTKLESLTHNLKDIGAFRKQLLAVKLPDQACEGLILNLRKTVLKAAPSPFKASVEELLGRYDELRTLSWGEKKLSAQEAFQQAYLLVHDIPNIEGLADRIYPKTETGFSRDFAFSLKDKKIHLITEEAIAKGGSFKKPMAAITYVFEGMRPVLERTSLALREEALSPGPEFASELKKRLEHEIDISMELRGVDGAVVTHHGVVLGGEPKFDKILLTEFCPYAEAKGIFAEKSPKISRDPKSLYILFSKPFHCLAAMHGKNIAHRDVKLENMFVFQEGDSYYAKLGDYGLSKYLDTDLGEKQSNFYGSPFATSLEVFFRSFESLAGLVSPLSPTIAGYKTQDVWAMGVALWTAKFQTTPPWCAIIAKARAYVEVQVDDIEEEGRKLLKMREEFEANVDKFVEEPFKMLVDKQKTAPLTEEEQYLFLTYSLLRAKPEDRITASQAEEFITSRLRDYATII